jgi:hypothetical protein
MFSLSRIGPLITAAETSEFVELNSAEIPVEAIARMVGKYSGLAPAITALTAHCRTVYDHGGKRPLCRRHFPDDLIRFVARACQHFLD